VSEHRIDSQLDRALDAALAQALRAPELPRRFRAELGAARQRLEHLDVAQVRARLQIQHHEQLRMLQADFVRIRRTTLGTLLGAAFVAGAGAVIAMPWLHSHFGPLAPVLMAWGGVALGALLGAAALRGRLGLGTPAP
jgi:hypothetical protein